MSFSCESKQHDKHKSSVAYLLASKEEELLRFRTEQTILLEERSNRIEEENEMLKESARKVRIDFEHNVSIITEQRADIERLEKLLLTFQSVLKKKQSEHNLLKKENERVSDYKSELRESQAILAREQQEISKLHTRNSSTEAELKSVRSSLENSRINNKSLQLILLHLKQILPCLATFRHYSLSIRVDEYFMRFYQVFYSGIKEFKKQFQSMKQFKNKYRNQQRKTSLVQEKLEYLTKANSTLMNDISSLKEEVVGNKNKQQNYSNRHKSEINKVYRLLEEQHMKSECLSTKLMNITETKLKLQQEFSQKVEEINTLKTSILSMKEKAEYEISVFRMNLKTKLASKIKDLVSDKEKLKLHSQKLIGILHSISKEKKREITSIHNCNKCNVQDTSLMLQRQYAQTLKIDEKLSKTILDLKHKLTEKESELKRTEKKFVYIRKKYSSVKKQLLFREKQIRETMKPIYSEKINLENDIKQDQLDIVSPIPSLTNFLEMSENSPSQQPPKFITKLSVTKTAHSYSMQTQTYNENQYSLDKQTQTFCTLEQDYVNVSEKNLVLIDQQSHLRRKLQDSEVQSSNLKQQLNQLVSKTSELLQQNDKLRQLSLENKENKFSCSNTAEETSTVESSILLETFRRLLQNSN